MERDIVILEENHTGALNGEYHRIGQEIDDIVVQYTGILKSLTDGRLKGETADKLAEFMQETERLLSGMMEPIAGEFARKQRDYIAEIEAEDK